jgi:hypothetical protein
MVEDARSAEMTPAPAEAAESTRNAVCSDDRGRSQSAHCGVEPLLTQTTFSRNQSHRVNYLGYTLLSEVLRNRDTPISPYQEHSGTRQMEASLILT